jgi:hypothetical protein
LADPQGHARRPGREIAISLACAAVFGTAFAVYLMRSMPSRDQLGAHLVADAGTSETTGELADAQAVVGAFVGHVGARRIPAAYAMMARAYRQITSLETFDRTWASSPLLAGTSGVRLISTTRENVLTPSGLRRAAATSTAHGHLFARAGALDARFTFIEEDGERRILALFVGGVPVLQGVAIPGAVP